MRIQAIAAAIGLAITAGMQAQEVSADRPEKPVVERPEDSTPPERPDASIRAGAVLEAVASFRERRSELLAARSEIVGQMKGASVETRAELRASLKTNREEFKAAKDEFRAEIKEAASKLKEHARKVGAEERE